MQAQDVSLDGSQDPRQSEAIHGNGWVDRAADVGVRLRGAGRKWGAEMNRAGKGAKSCTAQAP
jgi:hypothetical protein